MKKTLLSLAIASLAAGQSVCAAVEKVYNEPDSVYIFSYAHPEDEGRSGLKFAWSPDGDKWLSVSDGFAYLKCDFGRWGSEKRMIKPLLEKRKTDVGIAGGSSPPAEKYGVLPILPTC